MSYVRVGFDLSLKSVVKLKHTKNNLIITPFVSHIFGTLLDILIHKKVGFALTISVLLLLLLLSF